MTVLPISVKGGVDRTTTLSLLERLIDTKKIIPLPVSELADCSFLTDEDKSGRVF